MLLLQTELVGELEATRRKAPASLEDWAPKTMKASASLIQRVAEFELTSFIREVRPLLSEAESGGESRREEDLQEGRALAEAVRERIQEIEAIAEADPDQPLSPGRREARRLLDRLVAESGAVERD